MSDLAGRAVTVAVVTIALGLVVTACATPGLPTGRSPSPSVSPSGSPAASPADGSPSPTTADDESPPADASSAPGAPVGLALRLTWCADVCVANPGTTVLDDGRVIWKSDGEGWIVRQLTATGLAQLRERLDATGALGASADYQPQLRPGPEPPGHGTTSYTFRLLHDGVPVIVNTGEPLEPEYWVNPPELAVLAELARSLQDPGTALPADAWAGEAEAFSPPAYLLLVALRPDEGPPPDVVLDVDDADWPIAAPIETVGAPYARDGDVSPNDRCLPISADLANRIAAADAADGRPRDLAMTRSEQMYAWARRNGSVSVDLQWLMPDQVWSCSSSLTW